MPERSKLFSLKYSSDRPPTAGDDAMFNKTLAHKAYLLVLLLPERSKLFSLKYSSDHPPTAGDNTTFNKILAHKAYLLALLLPGKSRVFSLEFRLNKYQRKRVRGLVEIKLGKVRKKLDGDGQEKLM